MTMRLEPGGPVRGSVAVPGSKSMSIRHLVVAAMAAGRSVLSGPLEADDTVAVRDAVTALGATVDVVESPNGAGSPNSGSDWIVTGTGGAVGGTGGSIDCRMSGTTLRIMAAVATHSRSPIIVTGDPALRRRPVGVLVSALRSLGADITDEHGFPPVRVAGGGLRGGRVEVDVSSSSQFASALLLAAPLARDTVEVHTSGTAAHAYIDLTVEALRSAGIGIEAGGSHDGSGGHDGARWWRVAPGLPHAGHRRIDHDASAACHMLAVAMATGGVVTVTNAGETRQPDAGLSAVFIAMGGTVTRDGDRLTVEGPEDVLPVDVDLSAMPDQVTTVSALAALAHGTSHIRGVGVTRGHETDRLSALAAELAKLGVHVDDDPDALHVHGRGHENLRPAVLATHNDHRLAMAFAALAARVPGIVIADPKCVEKTYPRFWHDLASLGVRVEPATDNPNSLPPRAS